LSADLIVFWVFAPIAIGSAMAMLLQRNPVHAALLLILNFFCLAVFYLVLGAELLFAVQIVVYAGAIMVLFLFVIMLLGVAENVPLVERIRGQRPLALLLGTGIAIEIIVAVRAGIGFAARAPGGFDAVNRGGNAKALGIVLFNSYFVPFEVTSVLLIVASVAAVVLGQRRGRAVTLAERAEGMSAPPDGAGGGVPSAEGAPAEPDATAASAAGREPLA
jgi:NADH-quinone oxidoreductase subunit J